MDLDFRIFDAVNGLAGHWAWLDACGRHVAVWGLLAACLLAVTVLWWPRLPAPARWRYLLALASTGAICAALIGLEAWLATHVLHHDLRARPANARWATVLITAPSSLAFPAWPAVVASALAVPTVRVARRIGLAMGALAALTGMALVFVGVNYPLDIITALVVGPAVGLTAAMLARMPAVRALVPPRIRVAAAWGVVGIWMAVVALTIKPASTEGDHAPAPAPAVRVQVSPPAPAAQALTAAARPARLRVDAATNGAMTVAAAYVTMPDPAASRRAVQDTAKRVVNAAFAGWPRLDLLTVTVTAEFPGETGNKAGTLYTATIARQDWPAGGFSSTQPLPGKKFFHPRYLAKPAAGR